LFYRLNSVPIKIAPLRDRKEDIMLLFRKFSRDFSDKYRMPIIQLTDEAAIIFQNYHWPGNVRQLKNITEQISIIEKERLISADTIKNYLSDNFSRLPVLLKNENIDQKTFNTEREILYKVLFDMKQDITDLKQIVNSIIKENKDIKGDFDFKQTKPIPHIIQKESSEQYNNENNIIEDTEIFEEENLSLANTEKELIIKSLNRHNGKRKFAAKELGISERTLYRKIKEYNL